MSNPTRTELTFRNQTGLGRCYVLLYQKNLMTPAECWVPLWKGFELHHTMTISVVHELEIVAADPYANYTEAVAAHPGEAFEAFTKDSALHLRRAASGSAQQDVIEVRSACERGSFDAILNRDRRPVAIHHNVCPAQTVEFLLDARMFAVVSDHFQWGEEFNPDLLAETRAAVNLISVASADIVVMKGDPRLSEPQVKTRVDNVVWRKPAAESAATK